MTLTEFLLARIAEDRMVALDCVMLDADIGDLANWIEIFSDETDAVVRLAGRFSEVRVLAECEAKRQIVDEYRTVTLGEEPDLGKMPDEIFTGLLYGLTDAMQWLAVPYADHPDYDEAWRP